MDYLEWMTKNKFYVITKYVYLLIFTLLAFSFIIMFYLASDFLLNLLLLNLIEHEDGRMLLRIMWFLVFGGATTFFGWSIIDKDKI